MGAVVGEPNTALSKTDDPTFTQTSMESIYELKHLVEQKQSSPTGDDT